MDGTTLLRLLHEQINEDPSTSSFIDEYLSYTYLYEGAVEIVRRIKNLTGTNTLTTVVDQQGYTLNADFLMLYLKNSSNNFYIKYNDGTSDFFLLWKDYEDIIYNNNTTSVSIPDHFTIKDDTVKDTRITSTATAAGAASGGQCTLTDSTAPFADVSAGDKVHNTTDGSYGVVLSVTSTSVLVIALFGGTNNDITSADVCIIQPQGRYQLLFDPPPSTVSHTATVYYVKRPAPVFSDYGMYLIPSTYQDALIEYASSKYKMRDREPMYAREFMQYWDRKVRMIGHHENEARRRKGWSVNLRI